MNRLLLLLFIACGISACKMITKPTIKHDTEIDHTLVDKINELDMKLFAAIQLNKYYELDPYLSPELKSNKKLSFKDDVLPGLSKVLANANYSIYDDYHVKSILPGNNIVIHTEKADTTENGYTIHLPEAASETYISVLKVEGNNIRYLVPMIYTRVGNNWKLHMISIGAYTAAGKNNIKLYHIAQQMEQTGDLLDAYSFACWANDVSTISDSLVVFDSGRDVKKYFNHISTIFNSKYYLPFTINEIESKPRITAVEHLPLKDELLLNVTYQSFAKSDAAMKKENDAVQQFFATSFPGIYQNNPMTAFTVTAQQYHGGKTDTFYFARYGNMGAMSTN